MRKAQEKRVLGGQEIYKERRAQEYVVTETNRERHEPLEKKFMEPYKLTNPELTERTYYRK